MSETTIATAAVNPQFATLAEQTVPWWAACTAQQQAAVQDDHKASGLTPEDYLAAAAEFASYAELAAQAGADDAEPQAEAPAAELAEAAGEEAEEARLERLGAEAKGLLRDATKAFRRGESAYRAGMLEAGRLAREYVARRLAMGHPRDNAVQALVGEWAAWASFRVDLAYVNRVLRAAEAHRLLAVEGGVEDKAAARVPYGHYRDAWCRLVERVPGEGGEGYVLLAGLEEECRAAYRDALRLEWPREKVEERCQGLVAEAAARQQAAARAEAAAKAEQARKAEAEAEEARKQQAAHWRREQELRQQAESAKAEDRARLEAQAEAVRQEKLAAQRAAESARAEAEKAERDSRRAEAEAEAAAKAQAKAQEAARKATQSREDRKAERDAKAGGQAPKADKPQRERAVSAANLIPTAEAAVQATAKDWAEMVAGFVLEHPEPETVLEALVAQLGESGELSARGVKACNAFLLAVRQAERKPAKPATNGTPAAAVA